MKRHIPIIIITILIVCLIVGFMVLMNKRMAYSKNIIDKAKEEFVFDYDEDIIAIDTQSIRGVNNKIYYIVRVYGEKTYVTYIYYNGEIWNYENQSN